MPEIKLTYFEARGRGEPTRLALTVGGIAFEDDRVAGPAWPELKPTTPYHALPVMTIDGKVAAQSGAMLRYAGKLGGLYPGDPLVALQVDEVVDTVNDLLLCIFRYRGDDKDRLRAERAKLVSEDIPRFFGGLDKRLETFGEGPWVVGDSVTIGDVMLCNAVNNFKSGMIEFVPKDVLDGYARVMKSYNAVMEHPKVVEWYKKNPMKIVE